MNAVPGPQATEPDPSPANAYVAESYGHEEGFAHEDDNRGTPPTSKPTHMLESVVIRFAGDSGDGMQLTGTQFSETSAGFGNDLATLPDYPAEIRAPIGTRAGVSAYQVHFSSLDIQTPGDELDALVAMNAAALLEHLPELKQGGLLVLDRSGFDERNLKLAGAKTNPLEDGSLAGYRTIIDDYTRLTINALSSSAVGSKDAKRCKNMFTLGMVYWIYGRPVEHTERWLRKKFASKPDVAEANLIALTAGYHYAETIELFEETYVVPQAKLAKGTYRKLSGNEAVALGLVAASHLAKRQLYLASYPITPASNILHELSKLKSFGVQTFQAEDEIAAACAAIGASYAGAIGVTSTSGPGVCLKSEAMNLAVMAELPLLVVDVQRGGPSTGLPTKTEQSDLLQVMFGRNGDSPMPVIAASSPAQCFAASLDAVRVAMTHMTPVVLLTDGYIANGTEPWLIPEVYDLPTMETANATRQNLGLDDDPKTSPYLPYKRDPKTLARPWAIPGTPGLEHRIGGLETEANTGKISYDGLNHEQLTKERAAKVAAIEVPDVQLLGALTDSLLVVSWGGTFGSVRTAVQRLRDAGQAIAHVHLEWINPFPRNLPDLLQYFNGRIVVPELNNGQMRLLLQGAFGIRAIGINKIQGKPFKVSELIRDISSHIDLANAQGNK